MCSLLLVCAVLKTLYSVKHILSVEECRNVGKGGTWWGDELAVVVATKPPGAVQKTLAVLEESKGARLYDLAAKRIKRKLCSRVCRHTSPILPFIN